MPLTATHNKGMVDSIKYDVSFIENPFCQWNESIVYNN